MSTPTFSPAGRLRPRSCRRFLFSSIRWPGKGHDQSRTTDPAAVFAPHPPSVFSPVSPSGAKGEGRVRDVRAWSWCVLLEARGEHRSSKLGRTAFPLAPVGLSTPPLRSYPPSRRVCTIGPSSAQGVGKPALNCPEALPKEYRWSSFQGATWRRLWTGTAVPSSPRSAPPSYGLLTSVAQRARVSHARG